MFGEFFSKKKEEIYGKSATVVSGLGSYSLKDTFECGQCFRYELIAESEEYVEYLTVVKDKIITVGQRMAGELIFYDVDDETFDTVVRPYFTLDTDYKKIRLDITSRTDSEWLLRAAELK